jgi:hypothetical protein
VAECEANIATVTGVLDGCDRVRARFSGRASPCGRGSGSRPRPGGRSPIELLRQVRKDGFHGPIYFDTFPDLTGLDPVAECEANIARAWRSRR